MLVELQPSQRDTNHRGRLVETLQGLGAQHRLCPHHSLVVERGVEIVGGEERGRGTTWGEELQLVALAHATGDLEQLTQGDPHGSLVLAGMGQVSRQGVNGETVGLLGAHRLEPFLAVAQDRRHRRDRLDVVDDRRAGVQTGDSGEWRTQTRLTTASLQGVQQGGLLATDVGAGARVDDDVQVVSRAEDVLPDVPGRVGLTHRLLNTTDDVQHLATDVDEGHLRLDGVGGDDDSLERVCGEAIMSGMSLQVPGSDSSPLTTR